MTNGIWNIVEAANVTLEIFIVLIYFSKLLNKKYESSLIYVIGYFLFALILFLTGLFTSNSTILISVTLILLISISCFLYEDTFLKKVFFSLLFIVIVFISEIFFIGIMTVLNVGLPSEIIENGVKRIIGMVGTKIIYFWIIIVVCRLINKKLKEIPVKQWIMIILMPIISTLILYILFYSLMSETIKGGILIYCIAVIGLLYINFAVFDFFETYFKQLRMAILEQIIERETINYQLIEKSYSSIREVKHDVRNQLSVVNDLIKNNDIDSAKMILNSISKQMNSINAVCYTGEPIIDSILNIKIQYAIELGIELTYQINLKKFNLDTIELCRVLGNALDNAIEGCERSKSEVPYIFICIKEVEDKLIIEISNTSDHVDVLNLQTKKNNKAAHGIGMSSIKNSVELLNGYMKYDYNNHVFTLNILISN